MYLEHNSLIIYVFLSERLKAETRDGFLTAVDGNVFLLKTDSLVFVPVQ